MKGRGRREWKGEGRSNPRTKILTTALLRSSDQDMRQLFAAGHAKNFHEMSRFISRHKKFGNLNRGELCLFALQEHL